MQAKVGELEASLTTVTSASQQLSTQHEAPPGLGGVRIKGNPICAASSEVHQGLKSSSAGLSLWPGLQCTVDGGSEAMFEGDKECW